MSAKPPVAAARPHQVESPSGARTDDYYWLRDDERKNQEMLDYLNAENAYTDAALAPVRPLQEKIYDEIVARIKQDDSSVPYRKKGYWYYRRFETGKEYPVYARKKGTLEAPEQILLDVNQPKDGRDLLAALKRDERTRDIKVMVISGRDDQFTRQTCLELGADDFQPKPFDALLMSRVARLAYGDSDPVA